MVLGLVLLFFLSLGVSKGTLREIDPVVEVNLSPLISDSLVF
jgi:hypothetical protein